MSTSDSDSELDPENSSSEELENLAPHTLVGEFEILGIIGEGGFGTVYLALDHTLERQVALKEYRPAALATRRGARTVAVRSQRCAEAFEAGLRSFINEARTLAKFDHPALVKVYRFWQENNTAYMAMPLYEGRTLKEVVKEQPEIVTEAWLKAMLAPLLDAVEALHGVQIFHRDIAPDNVLILENGAPMLLDFGAARQIIADMTQALTVILKPGYAPVEQYAEDAAMKQGPWTDIYALSAVIYFVITKQPPPNSVARVISDPMKPLEESVKEGFSQEFLRGIDAGLSPRPEGRPQSIAEFRSLLQLPTFTPVPKTTIEMPRAPRVKTIAPLESNKRTVTMMQTQNRLAADPNVTVAVTRGPKKVDVFEPPPAAATGNPAKPAARSTGGKLILGIGVAVIAALGCTLWFISQRSAAPPTTTASTEPPVTAVPAPPPAQPPPAAVAPPVPTPPAPPAAAAVTPPPSPPAAVATTAAAPPVKKPNAAGAAKGDLAASADSSSRKAGDAAGTGTGTLRIDVKPWGEVLVDNVSKGVSPPLKRIPLTEGKHTIQIAHPGFTTYSVDIQVVKDGTAAVSHQFK